MNNDDLEQVLELRESHSRSDEVYRKPIFYYASICFSVLAIWLVIYLCCFHQRVDGMGGMFDGVQYILGGVAALGAGFLCTVVGFYRSEKVNKLIRLHSILLIIGVMFIIFWLTFR